LEDLKSFRIYAPTEGAELYVEMLALALSSPRNGTILIALSAGVEVTGA